MCISMYVCIYLLFSYICINIYMYIQLNDLGRMCASCMYMCVCILCTYTSVFVYIQRTAHVQEYPKPSVKPTPTQHSENVCEETLLFLSICKYFCIFTAYIHTERTAHVQKYPRPSVKPTPTQHSENVYEETLLYLFICKYFVFPLHIYTDSTQHTFRSIPDPLQ